MNNDPWNKQPAYHHNWKNRPATERKSTYILSNPFYTVSKVLKFAKAPDCTNHLATATCSKKKNWSKIEERY